MKLTPLDIRHKEFKRGMRGYVDGEVDEFLDEIADEFERLFKENIELSERGEALQEKLDQYRNLEETLQNTLVAAQRSAEELRANAQKEAQLMLSEAELKAREMVNESYADKQAVEKQIVVLKSSEEDFRFKFRSLLEGYVKQLAEVDEPVQEDRPLRDSRPSRSKRPWRTTPPPPAERAAPAPAQAGRAHAAAGGAAAQAPAAPASQAPAAAPRPPRSAPSATPTPAPREQAAGAGAGASGRSGRPRAPERAAGDPRAPFLGEPDDLLSDVESEVDDNAFKW